MFQLFMPVYLSFLRALFFLILLRITFESGVVIVDMDMLSQRIEDPLWMVNLPLFSFEKIQRKLRVRV